MSASVRWETAGPDDTERLGQAWGEALQARDVLLLIGDLGAGKTTLVRGIARGLGVSFGVKSPTFALHLTYPGRIPVHHLDLYRVEDPRHTEGIGLDDLWSGDGVVLIEWGDRLPPLPEIPQVTVRILDEGTDRRILEATGDPALLARLRQATP